MARVGLLVAGLLVLLGGVALFLLGMNDLAEVNSCLTGLVCSIMATTANGASAIEALQAEGVLFEELGGFVGLLGVILLVIGATTKGNQPAIVSPVISAPTQTWSKFCTACGTSLPKTAAYCNNCGAKQA